MKKTRKIFTFKKRRHLPWLLFTLIAIAVKVLKRTYRIKLVDPNGWLQTREPWPVIFLLWHNRLLFTSELLPLAMRKDSAALVSASRDGQYAADFLRKFGINAVRGSSSRGGREALRIMRRLLKDGKSVAITPDGPRGPKYELQIGPVLLAEMTGVPIVPASFNAPCRWQLKGWDGTQIPKPFSKLEFVIGDPITIPRKLNTESREQARQQVQNALMAITHD
jgi:hypothetical protein